MKITVCLYLFFLIPLASCGSTTFGPDGGDYTGKVKEDLFNYSPKVPSKDTILFGYSPLIKKKEIENLKNKTRFLLLGKAR